MSWFEGVYRRKVYIFLFLFAWLIASKTPPEYRKKNLKTGPVEAPPSVEKAPHRRPRRVAR